jgi:6-phosphogluconolactonase
MRSRNKQLLTFPTAEELAENLAKQISILLKEAVANRQRPVLVVSGGSTPKPLFEKLAQIDIPWDRVIITLADERWVETDEPASNEQLVRTYLLQDKARAANFMGLKNKSATAAAGEIQCRERLAGLPRPFTVIVLGMGNDGHTASLIPGSPRLKDALTSTAQCVAIASENTSYERMTLTLPVLLDAGQIFLHITGQEKMDVLEQALAGGPVKDMPVRGILLQEKTPVQIFWAP